MPWFSRWWNGCSAPGKKTSSGACILWLHWDSLQVSSSKAGVHFHLLGFSPSPFLSVWKDEATPERNSGSLRFWLRLNSSLVYVFWGVRIGWLRAEEKHKQKKVPCFLRIQGEIWITWGLGSLHLFLVLSPHGKKKKKEKFAEGLRDVGILCKQDWNQIHYPKRGFSV